mmetsp:Transcript_13470/g.40650  ORF Transcript_13470/g.40650 Transcript_13470/m.40650 type:complete len:106 (-) Transcript_13470:64-381(-)
MGNSEAKPLDVDGIASSTDFTPEQVEMMLTEFRSECGKDTGSISKKKFFEIMERVNEAHPHPAFEEQPRLEAVFVLFDSEHTLIHTFTDPHAHTHSLIHTFTHLH